MKLSNLFWLPLQSWLMSHKHSQVLEGGKAFAAAEDKACKGKGKVQNSTMIDMTRIMKCFNSY